MKHLTAIFCLTLTLLLGSVGNSESADYRKGLTAARSGDFATALRVWTPLAKQGHSRAQYSLGWMYDQGKGVSQDHKTAVKWYRLAAKQGNGSAQVNLGNMYAKGQGVTQDHKTAVKWYTLAAKQGRAKAQNTLGYMYANGKGVSQDYKTAVKWYKLAAKQGNASAKNNLKELQKKITKTVTAKLKNARGIWGIKFGMDSQHIIGLENKSLKCISRTSEKNNMKPVDTIITTCSHKNSGQRVYFGYKKTPYGGSCPCKNLYQINRKLGKFTSAGWNALFIYNSLHLFSLFSPDDLS
jgi:uncharacterized protein